MTTDIENIKADEILDTRGLTCPMPLLKTKKILKVMNAGAVLEIIGSDPGSKKDLPEFGNKQGNQFLGMLDDPAGYTRFFIKRG